jgi:hypothetical protein
MIDLGSVPFADVEKLFVEIPSPCQNLLFIIDNRPCLISQAADCVSCLSLTCSLMESICILVSLSQPIHTRSLSPVITSIPQVKSRWLSTARSGPLLPNNRVPPHKNRLQSILLLSRCQLKWRTSEASSTSYIHLVQNIELHSHLLIHSLTALNSLYASRSNLPLALQTINPLFRASQLLFPSSSSRPASASCKMTSYSCL